MSTAADGSARSPVALGGGGRGCAAWVAEPEAPGEGTLVREHVGGKGWNLARLGAAGARVPRWIAIPPSVFDAVTGLAAGSEPSEPPPRADDAAERREGGGAGAGVDAGTTARAIDAGIADAGVTDARFADTGAPDDGVTDGVVTAGGLGGADGLARRREAALAAPLPEALVTAVREALERAGIAGGALAVRSSAVGEDAEGSSFAGQFDTRLGVRADRPEELWEAVRAVWASAFEPHALAYAARTGEPARMAVILQEMVEPEVSGVAFSADPVTGDRGTAVVSAVYGLGEGIVGGLLDADTFRVAADGTVERRLVAKPEAVRSRGAGGTGLVAVSPHLRYAPALTDEEAREIARVARELGERLGGPQDVEWALTGSADGERTLHLLQTRPITSLPPEPGVGDGSALDAAAGERRIWDNSNIVESYGGVTGALTFSFARSVYADVYVQFCRLMGVPEPVLTENRPVIENMLGRIRGRVYYNLLNWYRTLALLPGFALNREFMERMMGVRERLEDPPSPPRAATRARDALRLAGMSTRMLRAHARLSREVPAFHRHVDAVLAPLAREDLGARTPDELLSLYRRLEDELLGHWRAPLVNDFFAMIWFGVLARLVEGWLPDEPPTLMNDLVSGQGGIVSAEPARRVAELARLVRQDAAVVVLFADEPDDAALWRRLGEEPAARAIVAEIGGYLERFGDRCMNELKLETVTLSENPAFLIQSIRAYLRPEVSAAALRDGGDRGIRSAAEERVHRRLRGARRRIFDMVLHRARARVRDRENLRFERTRVFGVVRRIFLALGGHLAAAGRIDDPRDVFHLTVEEVFGELEGTGVTTDLRALAALRREELARFAAEPPPPDRFETTGSPARAPVGREGPQEAETPHAGAAGELHGLGCCPGVVRAPVRVVRDPSDAGDLAGRILVAERTDPGWTLLFPAARGLLVQRGSLLSHSAIVAREMGLPCVVGIPGLLGSLADGEVVEMDGATGVVRRIAGAGERDGER